MIKKNSEVSNIMSFYVPTQFKYFFIILTFFSATWLISNVTAVKLVSIFGVVFTGGFIIFPFTAMLSAIIVEVYGYKNARQAIWAGLILNLSFVFFINIVNLIPPAPHWELGKQFHNILIPETRIIFASLISFILSDFSNSYLMAKMKITNLGRSLFKRIILSSSASITIDIICFMLLAYYGTMPTFLLINLISVVYLKKYLCQILLLPVIWYLIGQLKYAEGIEIYDFDTKFNPFSIDNLYEFHSIKKINTKQQDTNFYSELA